ncbi:MAG: DedA family protein [Firmicutes bacterium]|nr:DedA family protein [Alicyclobacillaceae bacterium]MCL6496874.1 DedA family protein [Bacillota bacterium]
MHWVLAITDRVLTWGLVGVGVGMFLESAYLPLPSEVILPFAGYLVAHGRATFVEAVVVALVGSLFGGWAGYELARYGGRPLLERWGRYVGLRPHELDRAERWFRRHGDGAVLLGRLLPGVRTYISLPAGVAAMPRGRFLLFSALGALPWTVLFTYVGWIVGQSSGTLSHLSHLFAAAAGVAAVGWLVYLWRHRRAR